MVLCGMRQPYHMLLYFVPDARCRNVMASFIPGSIGALHQVRFLAIRGATLANTSSNISGGILMKFSNASVSSLLSSAISWS